MAAPVVTAVLLFPSISPTPPTIPITTAADNTPAITNNGSVGKHATIDNVFILNGYKDGGGIGEVDNFDSLVMDFHNTNKNKIVKNDTFSPSTKKSKITDTDNTYLKQKEQNYRREEDIVLCRSFINPSKYSI